MSESRLSPLGKLFEAKDTRIAQLEELEKSNAEIDRFNRYMAADRVLHTYIERIGLLEADLAKEYGRIAQLEAENARLRELLKRAYYSLKDKIVLSEIEQMLEGRRKC